MRGKRALLKDGKTPVFFHYDIPALTLLEERTGKALSEVIEAIQGKLSITLSVALIDAGLAHLPTLTDPAGACAELGLGPAEIRPLLEVALPALLEAMGFDSGAPAEVETVPGKSNGRVKAQPELSLESGTTLTPA